MDDSISQEKLAVETRFFKLCESADADIKAIVNFLSAENDKREFVKVTVDRIGYPRWDKALKSAKGRRTSIRTVCDKKTNGSTVSKNYDTYYIPFVRDSQNYVNAALVIKVGPADTSFSYQCDWQYK